MYAGAHLLLSIVLTAAVLYGIKLMSSPKTAVRGNQIGALSMFGAVLLVLVYNQILTAKILWAAMIAGAVIGYWLAVRVSMLQMPQAVALFNGLGGGASMLVALVVILESHPDLRLFNRASAQLALIVGGLTLSGSLVAAGKLHRLLGQRPITLRGHSAMNLLTLIVMGLLALLAVGDATGVPLVETLLVTSLAVLFGVLFTVRVGGADMPVTISLLNSLSGLAGAICGFAINDLLLVAVGAVVGAAGLVLTQIMCRAMNRSLLDILMGKTAVNNQKTSARRPNIPSHLAEPMNPGKASVLEDTLVPGDVSVPEEAPVPEETPEQRSVSWLKDAKKVIIVPGYGMALAQAQGEVKKLFDLLETQGKDVKFAIHPVAGRMPGHMNVLLAEVDIPYEKLYEMDDINAEFSKTDVAIVIGACDVVNPAATTAEGTPIYGMPILRVDEARHVIVSNLDCKPGYSGVENPLYLQPHVALLLGDAATEIGKLTTSIS